jgi:arabinofuranan 3-O-arabinosyltransferase
VTATVWRFRLSAVCLLLVTLAFLQSPGEVAADTKLDLTVDPVGFLGRALTLWEPQGFFGQVQNQAYGYLFPMGPFFAAGSLLGLPGWVVQRLWWGLLLCVAFLGVVKLMAVLARGTSRSAPVVGGVWPLAQVVAGLMYALAPRMVSTIGPISAETLPMALAPWLLVPLVLADQGRDPRRMAAWSGLVVLGAGAVNAVATLAILPLGAWWLATRPPGRRGVAGWWLLAVGLATAWWVGPLLLLGRYSPPFLDWIESASVTTGPTDVAAVLRGASHWVPYVVDAGGPAWPAGFALVAQPLLVAGGCVVVGVGLLGLTRPTLPERGYLVGAVGIGVVLVTLGHVGPVSGVGAAWVQEQLDGVLAPLRNVHKADPVLRLPLAVAAGFLVSALRSPQHGRRWSTAAARVTPPVVVAALVAASWPVWTGGLTTGRTHSGVPGYWVEAAQWLADQGTDRALVLPGSAFGLTVWGRAQDEPLQPLARSPWAVRDVVPLSSAGNIRLLDAVDAAVSSGRGSPALSSVLARAGVRWLVVRNDLAAEARPPRPILVRQALERSPGLSPVRRFGPPLVPFRTETDVVDDGLQQAYSPVEVWRVDGDVALATLRDATDVQVLRGAPEGVLAAAEAGVIGQRPVILHGDPVPSGSRATSVVTDSYRSTELNFGSVRDNRSNTLTPEDDFVLDRRVRDYEPVPPTGRQPTAREPGYRVRASSAGSQVDALRARAPSAQPWAAVDGDRSTSWISGDLRPGVGQWWEVVWDEPVLVPDVSAAFVSGGAAGSQPAAVLVTTDAGSASTQVQPTDAAQPLAVRAGPTRRLRIALTAVVDGTAGDGFGISEVDLPTGPLARPVEIPGTHPTGPIVFSARVGERPGCVHLFRAVQCSRQLPVVGEERPGVDRVLSVATAGRYRVAVVVRPRPGLALDRLLAPPPGSAHVSVSSRLVRDAGAGPQAMVDGDSRTAWYADPLDPSPTVTVRLPEPRQIRGLRVSNPPDLAASQPLGIVVRAGREERQGFVDARGRFAFRPLRAAELTVEFGVAAPLRSVDPTTGVRSTLPVAVAELNLVGARDLLRAARPFQEVGTECGLGPQVELDGVPVVATQIRAPAWQVLDGRLLPARPCRGSALTIPAGRHRVTVPSSAEFLVEQLSLVPVGGAQPEAAVEPPVVTAWGATRRSVTVPTAAVARVLETSENANAGWVAHLGDRRLEPVRVEGWRQAWLLPPGAGGEVELDFAPQRWYATALAAGLAAVLALAGLAVAPARRLPPRPLPDGPLPGGRRPLGGAAVGAAVGASVGAAVGLGLAIAGLPGLLIVTAALALTRVAPAAAGPLVATAWAGVTVLAVVWPWPGSQAAPTWVGLVTVSAAVVVVAVVVAVVSVGPVLRR